MITISNMDFYLTAVLVLALVATALDARGEFVCPSLPATPPPPLNSMEVLSANAHSKTLENQQQTHKIASVRPQSCLCVGETVGVSLSLSGSLAKLWNENRTHTRAPNDAAAGRRACVRACRLDVCSIRMGFPRRTICKLLLPSDFGERRFCFVFFCVAFVRFV